MSGNELVDRFMSTLRSAPEPELQTIALMAGPQLAMMRDKSGIVVILDRMAEMWAQSRGGRFEIEVTA